MTPPIYAEQGGVRARQVAIDVAVLLWVALWVTLGMHLHDLVTMLAVPGEGLTQVGGSLARGAAGIAGALDDVPLIGEGVAAPFSSLRDAADGLVRAGETTREVAHRLALWLSVIAAGAPIALVLGPWLAWRVLWARRASAARQLRDDPASIRLLALRAAATRPVRELQAVSDDPVRDLEERPEALAALELRRLGLRPPPDR